MSAGNDDAAAAAAQSRAHTYLSPEWRAVVTQWRNERLHCAWCGLAFYEIANIGQWHCRQHRQTMPDTARGLWRCCGTKVPALRDWATLANAEFTPDLSGCVASDHRVTRQPWTPQDSVPMHTAVVSIARAPRAATVDADSTDPALALIGVAVPPNTVFVYRYDVHRDTARPTLRY